MMEYIYYALGLGIAGAIVYITLALPIDTKAKIKLILATVTGAIAFIGYRKVKSWKAKADGYDELESKLRYEREQTKIEQAKAQKYYREAQRSLDAKHKAEMALQKARTGDNKETADYLNQEIPGVTVKVGGNDSD